MDPRDEMTQPTRLAWWVVAVALLTAGPAPGATIVVTTAADVIDGPNCTLRDALTAANSDAAAGACTAGQGADRITFAIALPAAIELTTNAPLAVESEVTILGPGAEQLAIDGNHSTRVMEVSGSGRLTASGLTIRHGTTDGRAGGLVVDSASLSLPAAATLNDCAITGNAPAL